MFLLDIEAIFTDHYCLREVSLLDVWDKTLYVFYGYPCKDIRHTDVIKQYEYCSKRIHGLTYNPHPREYKMMDTKLNNLTVKYKVTSCKEIEHYIKSILIEPFTLYHKGGNLETRLMEKLFTMYKCINIEDVYYSTKDDIALYFKQLKETLCDKSIHGKLLNHHNWTQHCSANEVLYFYIKLCIDDNLT